MNDCLVCQKLHEEEGKIEMTEVYIRGYGYCNFRTEINFCPKCGKPLYEGVLI